MERFGWLLLLVVAAVGAGGAYALSEAFRADARESWESEAAQSAQWLSGTVLNWLEESYAPLSAVAVLFENSSEVTEDEFLGAVDSLEARATAIFVDRMAVVRPAIADGDERWSIRFSTDPLGLLSPDVALSVQPAIVDAVEAAISRRGQTVLGRPFSADPSLRYSAVALAIADSLVLWSFPGSLSSERSSMISTDAACFSGPSPPSFTIRTTLPVSSFSTQPDSWGGRSVHPFTVSISETSFIGLTV